MNDSFTSDQEIRSFAERLTTELLIDLPGVAAHLRLAPTMRIDDIKTGRTPDHALESAVLIILYPFEGRLYTVVILRNEYDGAHSGQISLPGGKRDAVDLNFLDTALREAHEEIGIIKDDMTILGQLSRFYVRPSNFVVYPYVAYCSYRPQFQPDAIEVQRIIEIDIFEEIRYDKMVTKTLTFKNNIQVEAPGFVVGNAFMWGATAMIFSELLQMLNRAKTEISNHNID